MVSLFCLGKPLGKITKVTTSWKETGKDLEIETPGLMASKFFWLKIISQISRRKYETVMRPVSICKGEQGTSLANLTEKKRSFASFREAESMLLRYFVLTHVANGCPIFPFSRKAHSRCLQSARRRRRRKCLFYDRVWLYGHVNILCVVCESLYTKFATSKACCLSCWRSWFAS